MGAFFRMPVVSGDLQVFVAQARRKGANVITTQLLAERTMYEMDWSQDTWLIVGNEGAGVSGEVAQLASHTVRIPMASGVESLNVAMAASVLLYEAYRQRL
jgi:TrmH family RNA methyltransferase